MATDTKTKTEIPTPENLYERANEAGEKFVAAARKAGTVYIDSYEKVVDQAIDLELKLAASARQEWLKEMIETQANFARDLNGTYTSAVRTLLA